MEHDEMPTGAGPPRTRLLLVDDEPDLLSTLAEILEHQGYTVVSSLDGEEAVNIASLYEPNLVVTDYALPNIDGVTTIQKVREQQPQARAILVSGYISPDTRRRASAEQVDRIMEKPVSVPELLSEIRSRTRS